MVASMDRLTEGDGSGARETSTVVCMPRLSFDVRTGLPSDDSDLLDGRKYEREGVCGDKVEGRMGVGAVEEGALREDRLSDGPVELLILG